MTGVDAIADSPLSMTLAEFDKDIAARTSQPVDEKLFAYGAPGGGGTGEGQILINRIINWQLAEVRLMKQMRHIDVLLGYQTMEGIHQKGQPKGSWGFA
eukprot:12414632-Karenia_brevis.AAC.1